MKKLNKYLPLTDRIRKSSDFFIHKISSPIKQKALSIWMIEFVRKKKLLVRWMGYSLVSFLFLFDIIISVIVTVVSMICGVIGYMILLTRLLKDSIRKIMDRMIVLSDKRVIAVSFRISLIISLTITVILNRYEPFLKEYDASTAVLEFMASSIIIPIMFEWINSLGCKKDK